MAELPRSVIDKDHQLEERATKATEALAKHRHHHTLDENNPNRVSIRAYADAVGRSYSTIRSMVTGYATWLTAEKEASDRGAPITHSLNDQIQLAGLTTEKAAAAEAIAAATGTTAGNVTRAHRNEIADVVHHARERAEAKGTTVEEEIPKAASARAKDKARAKRVEESRKAGHTLVYLSLEGRFMTARRNLTDALKEAHDVDLSDDEMELLRDTVNQLKALIDLIGLRFGGTDDIDWDAELARLGELS
jgi:hypothetical protein